MPKIYTDNLKLAGVNSHLKDVFTENSYLELGSINYQVLARLLNKEVIDYKEICDFKIEEIGIGYGNITNEEIKNIIPFLFFQNINNTNKSMQIFITYGLICYTENKKEKFAPLVLIPVNMYYINNEIKFQLLSKPLENKVVVDKFYEKNKYLQTSFKIDTPSSIDKYVLSYKGISKSHVSFESYLTYALTRSSSLMLDHKKFKFKKESIEKVKGLKDTSYPYYGVDYLNTEQLQAIYNAKENNSFAIRGRVGSGKTTTLLNIAYDKMYEGKTVLYVSNSTETIKDINQRLKSNGFDKYSLDLTVPTSNLPKVISNSDKYTEIAIDEKIGEIKKLYQYVNEYEHMLFGRINDFRYNEVLTELANIQSKEPVNLSLDNLIYTYKHEYEEILESMKVIQKEFKHFNSLGVGSFNKSCFSEIPTNLEPTLIDQEKILKVLTEIDYNFTQLVLKVYELYKKYNFKRNTSFGQLGQTRSYIEEVNIDDIPINWIEETGEVFDKAKKTFVSLEDEIFDLQTIKFDINSNYLNYKSINIDHEINTCLGQFFDIEDDIKIDNINENKDVLNELARSGAIDRETFVKTQSKIRRIIGYNFQDEIDVIKTIVNFSTIVNNCKVNKVYNDYLNEKYYNTNIKEVTKCVNYLNDYYKDLDIYFNKYHKEESMITEVFRQFKELEAKPRLKFKKEYRYIAKYKKDNNILSLENDIKFLEDLKNKQEEVSKILSIFEKLTGHKYSFDVKDVEGDITKYVKFISQISINEIKKRLVEYVQSDKINIINNDSSDDINVFNRYANTFKSLMNVHNVFSNFIPLSKHKRMNEYLNDILISHKYFKDVFESNKRMKPIMVNSSNNFITFEEYITFRNKQNTLFSIERSLVSNKEYKYLYGKYYKDVATSTPQIKKIINFYQNYRDLFKTNRDCYLSFSNERRMLILNIFDNVREISDNLTQLITTYNIIFKGSYRVSYYKNSFKEVRNYLRGLIKSSDELKTYLTYLTNIQVVNKHKLYGWCDYLVYSENLGSVVNDFSYTYFKSLNDHYLLDNKEVSDTSRINACLDRIYELHLEINEATRIKILQTLKRTTVNRVVIRDFTDYDDYIEKTNDLIKLYIANTNIINDNINLDKFDIVLIDDSSCSSSDDYGNLVKEKQVVIAGLNKVQTLFANDVISRMRTNVILDLENRYEKSPLEFSNEMDKDNSCIHKPTSDNYSVEVYTDSISKLICNLIEENINYKINVFSPINLKTRTLLDDVCNELTSRGFDTKDILMILNNNINISDLKVEYILKSDYNILYLEEYSNQIYDNNSQNFFDYIIQARKKLYIYDNKGILYLPSGSLFIDKLKPLVQKHEILNNDTTFTLLKTLSKHFSKHKIKAYTHHEKVDLILEYKSNLYGVVIYFNNDASSYELIEDYLNVYVNQTSKGFKVFKLFLYDLSLSCKEAVNKIAKEIIQDANTTKDKQIKNV